ncbi:PrsW family intramembrane metalloprotease [Microbacterium tumbae]
MAVVAWLGSITWAASQIGFGGVGLGLASSLVITIPVAGAFLWLNRWNRARPALLLSAFAWGASVAAFCSIWSQQWLHSLVDALWGVDAGLWVRPLIITPVTEEVLKGLLLVWLLVRRRREITGVLDGIVYAGLVGVGFSFTENSLYLGRPLIEVLGSGASDAAAISVLGVTIFMRVLMMPFFHSLMVALTGIGAGIAARSRGRGARLLPVALGLLAAIVLHGIWDWAGLASSDPYLIFKIYAAVMVPVFVAVLILAVVLRRRGGRMIAAGVPVLVRSGDIASGEAESLTRLRARRQWRAEVRRSAGRTAARALGRYQAEATVLAIRVARGSAADRDQLAEQRRVVAAARASAAMPPAGSMAAEGGR